MTNHDARAHLGTTLRRVRLALFLLLTAAMAAGAIMQGTRPPLPVRMPPDLLPERPPIVGVAHIGLKVSSLAAARQFCGHVLGFQEPFKLANPDGSLALTYFKVNDHQYIEIFPTLKSPDEDRLSHIALETTNAKALRDYLAFKGVRVPDRLKPGRDGNLSFMVFDPDGHRVEFVQYLPGSLHARNFGKFLPATRISNHIQHVGIAVKDRAAADKFYKDILGFRVGWHGGRTDSSTDWVDMVVPDGHDWVEYMLNVRAPTPRQLGGMHHLSLRVPSIQAGYKTVTDRGYSARQPQVGRDGKWQLNLFDPDFTRVELMEPHPVRTPCCSPMPEWQ